MAVDFPNSPTVGQIYSANGVTRRWDGTTWSIVPVTIQGVTGATGLQGLQGPSGITTATAPLTYDAGTKTVALSYGSSLTTSASSLIVNSTIVPFLANANTFTTSPQIINAAASQIGLAIKANSTTPGDIQQWQNSSGTALAKVDSSGNLTAAKHITTGGASTQFVKGDGTLDSSTYLTNAVTSLAGTTNQITASASTGSVTLSLPSAVTMPGSLTVTGDLTVNGTTTTINATTLVVDDINIELGSVTTPTDATAAGGGITLKGAADKTIVWQSTATTGNTANTGYWNSTDNLNLNGTGKAYYINGTSVLSGTTLGSGVTASSLTSVGTLANLTVTNPISGSVTGNAGTVTNGVYTNISNTISGSLTAQSFIPSSATVPTNGMYLPTTNTVSLATNTTERFRIDANGSVKLFGQILESATVSATAANTTVTYDVITNKNVLFYTTNATANWTFNVRGSATVALNTLMDIGQSLTVVFLNTNGGTAFYPTAFQIDTVAVTPKWQGGTAPTSGNINSIDGYSYTIIKTASATYTVLASQTKFT